MTNSNQCPHCGKAVPPTAPGGICPECMLKAGLASQPGEAGLHGSVALKPGSAPPPSPADLAKHFPQLEILAVIGHGGMGAVYKARQKALDRVVALKILPPGIGEDPAFAERFVREAKALARLNHPGVVTLYEFGQADGLFFFLMEFVDGVNLRQLLEAGRLSPREALAIVPQICDALQYAHDQGIVHRDIKPENVLLDRQGRVKVADFGLAKLVGAGAVRDRSERSDRSDATTLTEAGKVMGTPQYMAPEQREHPTEVDHRADIYSLGVVFYQMLTGELPGKPIEPPSKKVQIDVRLDEVVLRALEKEPERRYQQVSQVKTAVETIATSAQSQAPMNPPSVIASSAALERTRWMTVAAGFILCMAGAVMGFNSTPGFGIPVVIWAAVGFILIAVKALRARGTMDVDVGAVQSARKILLVDTIGICFAGAIVALEFAGLAKPFAIFIAFVGGAGIVASVLRLLGMQPFSSFLAPPSGAPAPAPVQVQLVQYPWGVRIGLAFVVLAALTILGFALHAWLSARNRANVTLTGTVSDATTDKPIPGAQVAEYTWLPLAPAQLSRKAQTDSAGRYALCVRRTDPLYLGAWASGYETSVTSVVLPQFSDVRKLGQDFALQPTNAVRAKLAQKAEPPGALEATLPFLMEPMPEFREFNLKMTEERLKELINQHRLLVTFSDEGEKRTYRVFRTDGENVIVGFRGNECSGIQRMRRDVEAVEKLRALGSPGTSQDAASVQRLKLEQAEQVLQRTARLFESNLVGEAEYEQARFAVQIAAAEMKGDTVQVARLKLQEAEAAFKRASELFERKMIGEAEHEKAKFAVKIAAAELEAAEGKSDLRPKASVPAPEFGPVIERVIRSESNQIWALNLASDSLVRSGRERPLDFRVGQATTLRTAKVDLYQPFEASTSDTLKALDMHLLSLGPEAWDIPANEAIAQLDKNAAAVHIRQSEVFLTGSTVYVFSTREGAKGVLQILKGTMPAKLRYKVVQPAPLRSSQMPKEGKSSESSEWGEAVEGVQVRLRADRTVWTAGQIPAFKADLRNQGNRDLIVVQSQVLAELEVDGTVFQWGGGADAKSSGFPPGREYQGIPISLTGYWRREGQTPLEYWKREDQIPMKLALGKHTVRIAFIAEPNQKNAGKPVRVVSNPVEIELARSYPVNKPVSAFPDQVDLTTPESACAAVIRALSRDIRECGDLTWQLDTPEAAQRRERDRQIWQEEWQRLKADPEAFTRQVQTMLAATIVEVCTDGDDLAGVIVLGLHPKERTTYRLRFFGRADGRWKNLGEYGQMSLDEARSRFEEQKDHFRSELARRLPQRRYPVGKTVSTFSTNVNLSTPESAFASVTYALLRDTQEGAKLYFEEYPKWEYERWAKLRSDLDEFARVRRATLETEIVEVIVYRDAVGGIVLRCPLPLAKDVPAGYLLMVIGKPKDHWKLIEEKGAQSVETARQTFDGLKERYWERVNEARQKSALSSPTR